MNREEIEKEVLELKDRLNILEKELTKEADQSNYPCLKTDERGQVVLFIAENTGYNINGIGWEKGYFSKAWRESAFELFDGEVKSGVIVGARK